MSIFELPTEPVGEAGRRGMPNANSWHVSNKPPRKKSVSASRRHVAAPHDWVDRSGALPASSSDQNALRKAMLQAAAVDAEAAMDVLSKYNLTSLAECKKAQVCNVHFDLVMLTFYPDHTTL